MFPRCLVPCSLVLAVAGGIALAGIEGSKHDFSGEAWSKEDVCGACHVPHRAEPPKAAPLWEPDADLSRRFGSMGEREDPGSPGPGRGTLMCLRCHDGTIARETLTGTRHERFRNSQHPGLFSTGHGTSDHPVGVIYPSVDKGYRPVTAVVASGTVTLPGGKVECTSCHDPHGELGLPYMLVTSNARSALCLTCHRK